MTNVTAKLPTATVEIKQNTGAVRVLNSTAGPSVQGALTSGLLFNFSTTTTIADPSSGNLRFDSGTYSAVTEIAISEESAASGSPDVSDWINYWDDSESQVIITERNNEQNVAIFNVASVVDNTGWHTITVEHVFSNGSFSNGANLSVLVIPGIREELPAVSKTIVSTANVSNISLYDSSLDTDGGAWRHRCQNTSWYNETLNTSVRGSRREFPSRAAVRVWDDEVIIYDLDDDDAAMWMVISDGQLTLPSFWRPTRNGTAAMIRDGVLAISLDADTQAGLLLVDFITDTLYHIDENGGFQMPFNIADRENDTDPAFDIGTGALVSGGARTYDVAMTTLPGTPIDKARGLPFPTVAVATEDGVKVVHYDFRIATESAGLTMDYVEFDPDNTLIYGRSSNSTLYFAKPHQYQVDFGLNFWQSTSEPAPRSGGTLSIAGARNALMRGNSTGLDIFRRAPGAEVTGAQDDTAAMVAYITDTYNTGWMVGDIKGSFLSSVSTASLVGSGNLISNGDFPTDMTGWTDHQATSAVVSGEAEITIDAGQTVGGIYQNFSVTIGQKYLVTAKLRVSTATDVGLRIQDASTFTNLVVSEVTSSGTDVWLSGWWTPTESTNRVYVRVTGSAGDIAYVDDISAMLVDDDRSVNAKGLAINGTITRTAVATGAELVGYSGFTLSNYLQQPYNSEFDFGTGDFSVMSWVKTTDTQGAIAVRRDTAAAGNFLGLRVSASKVQFLASTGISSAEDVDDDVWHHVAGVRRSGTMYVYVDGRLSNSAVSAVDVSNSTAILRIGLEPNDTSALTPSQIALLRISANAPTPDQIRAIYNDERRLFFDDADCVLPAADVDNLSYDPITDYVEAIGSGGRSRIQGIEVIDQDAVVSTMVASLGGDLLLYDGTDLDYSADAIGIREKLLGHNGGPPLDAYDPNVSVHRGTTVNATPTVVAHIPVAEMRGGLFRLNVSAKEYSDGAEVASYEIIVSVIRQPDSNIALSGSSTKRVIQEVTASMDAAAGVNTTAQTITVTGTGVASTNILWTVKCERIGNE